MKRINAFQEIKRDRDAIVEGHVGTKEIVEGDEESGQRDSAVFRSETVSSAHMKLVGAVKAFNKLLKGAVSFRDGIKVLKTDNVFQVDFYF